MTIKELVERHDQNIKWLRTEFPEVSELHPEFFDTAEDIIGYLRKMLMLEVTYEL